MKHLKMLGLAAVAAMALMAIGGAGSASATVFCKATQTPCSVENEWPLGTFGDGTLAPGTSGLIKNTSGGNLITCTEGTISGELQSKGSGTETVKQAGSAANVNWKNCTVTMDTIKGGEIEIHHIAGTDNGTVTVSGFETTVIVGGSLDCIYTWGTGTDAGTITGGTKPTMDIHAVLHKTLASSFLCPETVVGEATGVLTQPTGAAYIEDE